MNAEPLKSTKPNFVLVSFAIPSLIELFPIRPFQKKIGPSFNTKTPDASCEIEAWQFERS
jgi:hypothetical protein